MLLDLLKNNKGTVSSQLGKECAKEVLNGNQVILDEALSLVMYELKSEKEKNVRAGAAKIIEKVAEKAPEKVAPFLSDILHALDAKEPQTRWMVMMTFGYCAPINTQVAEKGIQYAKNFIAEQNGVCLSGASELFLGKIGSISKKLANTVFPILLDAYDNALANEIDWIFEAFIMITKWLTAEQKKLAYSCVEQKINQPKKSTLKRQDTLMIMLTR